MATSGTLNTNGYDGRYLQFSWTATQDVLNNKSTVTWTLKGAGTGSVGYYESGNFAVIIDGNWVYSTGKWDRIRLYDGTVVASGTKTFYHKADGTCTFNVSIQAGIYTYDVNCTASTTFTLTQIPRASSVTVSDNSPDMGETVTFNISRAATAFTHKLTLTWGGATSDIATGVGTSATWAIPLSLANNIPDKASDTCYITCITYNGSTEVGRKQISMTLNVPASIKPSISAVTISEAESGLASKFGAYIQNKSKLKIVTTASGSYKSTIKKYEVKILGKTYTGGTVTSDIITLGGSIGVIVTVTDSRGRTDETIETVSVLYYTDPRITAFSVDRCNIDGTLNDEGEYLKIAYAFNITSLNDKNDKTYTIAYKLKDASNYTTLETGNIYNADTTVISKTVFSGDNSYDFKLTVTDYFKPVFVTDDVPTAFTLMDFHSSGTGMAIGKVAETADLLEIALDVKFLGKVRGAIFDAIYPVGSIYLAYNHIDPATLFGGTWERLENAFLWASSESDTIGATGGEKTHTLTVSEMPRHKHQIGAYKSTDGSGVTLDAYSSLVSTSNGTDTTSKYYTSGALNVGGSQPHNNMPPYIQVSAWRRTA